MVKQLEAEVKGGDVLNRLDRVYGVVEAAKWTVDKLRGTEFADLCPILIAAVDGLKASDA